MLCIIHSQNTKKYIFYGKKNKKSILKKNKIIVRNPRTITLTHQHNQTHALND